jgi:NitT/TauT family transport system substrate-binding protein
MRNARWLILLACLLAVPLAHAQKLDKVVFGTNWLAEAEHGGFYQALAEGIYRRHGLDVTIRMGGPQVNPLQLLAAKQLDVAMGDDLQTLGALEQGLPITTIAATFQKNPTVIIAHPGVASLADLKGKPIAVGAVSNTTFWPWLKEKYGYTDAQKRPYAFSVQPFLADPSLSQQGYVTSEPFSIEKAGVKPVVFLLADEGYSPYAETLVVRSADVRSRADVLRRFVLATAEGWKRYLADPAPANALIKRDNPEMSDALLDYGHRKLVEYRIVTGGDAPASGIMTMTDARWRRTIDFASGAGIVRRDFDHRPAYTLDIVKGVKVLP